MREAEIARIAEEKSVTAEREQAEEVAREFAAKARAEEEASETAARTRMEEAAREAEKARAEEGPRDRRKSSHGRSGS